VCEILFFFTHATRLQQKGREKKCSGPPKELRAACTVQYSPSLRCGCLRYRRRAHVQRVREKPMFKRRRFVFDNRYHSR
jgi:hypothetical protein